MFPVSLLNWPSMALSLPTNGNLVPFASMSSIFDVRLNSDKTTVILC